MAEQIVDFHSHYVDAGVVSHAPPGTSAGLLERWAVMTDLDAQLRAMDSGGVDRRVLSAPLGTLKGSRASLPIDVIRAVNEALARRVAALPHRLSGLATIDAFSGDRGATEVMRAVTELGLDGICVDCADGERLLDTPEARPVLNAAASLGVVVFVHPVAPPTLSARLVHLGAAGVLLARGMEVAAALVALLRGGVLTDLPGLRIVAPMIAAPSLLHAGLYDHHPEWAGRRPSEDRKRLFFDTMGLDPPWLRYAVDVLGPEHVVLGTDYPIVNCDASRTTIAAALDASRLSERDRRSIAADNAHALLTPR